MARGLALTTPPVGEPLTLAEAKNHLRVDITDDDALIAGMIQEVREYVEETYNCSLVSRVYTSTIDRFPRYSSSAVWQYNSDAIWQQRLPVTQLSGQWYPDRAAIRVTRPPMQSLFQIAYKDGSGINQTLVGSIAAGVTGTGSQTVTPYSMIGLNTGNQLVIDTGTAQEVVTITGTTATTFTATFANTHPVNVPFYAVNGLGTISAVPTPLTGDAFFGVDTSTKPARIAPGYGQIWPIQRQQLASVNVSFVAGHGPVTTVTSAVAAGSQTVTPGSMTGIFLGTKLQIDRLNPTLRETVAVTALTATTFTATFSQAHAANFTVEGNIPERVRRAMKLLIGHWYENREGVGIGAFSKVPLAVESLLLSEWPAEYE